MPRLPSRPHVPRTRRGWLLAGTGILAIVAAVFAAAYLTMFRGSGVAPLALSGGSGATSGPPLTAPALPGTWTVTGGSVAGYRVRERLGFLPASSDAVGRTSMITGSVTIGGSAAALTVSATSFTVDVSTLVSDDPRRDQRIHGIGLESDRYPRASFTLATPIAVPNTAIDGRPFEVSATGVMTLHGTARTVAIPLAAQLSGSQVELVGSLTFAFEDFGMHPPSVADFVSVEDNATMEFDLHLRHT